ncbi:MAG: SusD/RagB family nutrient-binding outer membrane lipoprotein [Bacteroidia bacterium]|nr:SusD/RagB family nutrient-binding outer membrane lipoprotein [Bacteroidia bacterium]
MKKKIQYITLIFVVLVSSCELPDNIDPKYPKVISPEAVFTTALVALDSLIGDINVNDNISRLLVQYHSEVTYVTESRYNFQDRQIPDTYWGVLYRDVLMNLEEAKVKLEARDIPSEAAIGQKKNQLAIIDICAIYAYQVLVDAFGDVPYSEALMGSKNSRPKYDDAFTIYKDLVVRLNKAIANLSSSYEGFGIADVLYNGDVDLWKKFGASLKLRIGMRLTDLPAANAATIVNEAIASGVFSDQSESAILHLLGVTPLVNSYYNEYVTLARKDFCPTNTIIDMMNILNDPRRDIWFTKYEDGYVGLQYGKVGASNYYRSSHFADIIRIDPKYPVIMCDYVEVEFLLAEAAERNIYGTPADAAVHYNNAILASMKYWGVADDAAAEYLAQASVAYSTATGSYRQKIGNQKWLGLFDRGVESWAEWRRLDFPILNPPVGMAYTDIPMRMPYPYNENKMNLENYTAAAAAIGGDIATTKLFWDKN